MKKCLFVFLVLISTRGIGQTTSDTRKVNIAFTVSPSISWLGSKESGVESDGVRLGYNYGFLADVRFDDNYFFATGITINNVGGKLKYPAGKGYTPSGDAPVNPGSYRLKMQQVMIPLSLKLKTNEINKFQYWGQFGSYLGINMGARLFDGGQGLDKHRASSAIQPINAGLLLGAGVEFVLDGKTRAQIGANFENGFVDATRNSKWQDDGKMVINNLVIRLGVFF